MAGNGTNTDVLRQPLTEMQIVVHTVFRHVEHHVVGTLRIGEIKSELTETVSEKTFHVSVVRLQTLVITVGETQADGGGFHQGSGGTDG